MQRLNRGSFGRTHFKGGSHGTQTIKGRHKILEAAKVKSLGKLAEYTASGKRLTDLAGIGPALETQIVERLDEFWRSRPDLWQEPEASVAVK